MSEAAIRPGVMKFTFPILFKREKCGSDVSTPQTGIFGGICRTRLIK